MRVILAERLKGEDVSRLCSGNKMNGAVASASGYSACRRCKAKLVSGLKSSKCDNLFHPSYAKLFNVTFLLDGYTICCEVNDV